MLTSVRRRTHTIKRLFAAVFLAYFAYLGFVRFRSVLHADTCLDSGGHYDTATDVCRY